MFEEVTWRPAAKTPTIDELARLIVEREKATRIPLENVEELLWLQNWSKEKTKQALSLYRDFLAVRKVFPTMVVIPSEAINTVWQIHAYLLEEYRETCEMFFGDSFPYDPYSHLAPAQMELIVAGFEATKGLFEKYLAGEATWSSYGVPFYFKGNHSLC